MLKFQRDTSLKIKSPITNWGGNGQRKKGYTWNEK